MMEFKMREHCYFKNKKIKEESWNIDEKANSMWCNMPSFIKKVSVNLWVMDCLIKDCWQNEQVQKTIKVKRVSY